MPIVAAFEENAYSRYANGKLLSQFRRSLPYDNALTDLRRTTQRYWKSTRDLMEYEASIVAVRALVHSANKRTHLLNVRNQQLREQTAASRRA